MIMSCNTLEIKVAETIRISDVVLGMRAIVYDPPAETMVMTPFFNFYDGPAHAFAAVRRFAARPPTYSRQQSLFSSPL